MKNYKKKDNGFIYLIFDGKYFKIGKTDNLEARFKTIKSSNINSKLIASSYRTRKSFIENYLHAKFRIFRKQGEWFLINDYKELVKLWLSFSTFNYDFDEIASINFNCDISIIKLLREYSMKELEKESDEFLREMNAAESDDIGIFGKKLI
jgi:hypothetical protein